MPKNPFNAFPPSGANVDTTATRSVLSCIIDVEMIPPATMWDCLQSAYVLAHRLRVSVRFRNGSRTFCVYPGRYALMTDSDEKGAAFIVRDPLTAAWKEASRSPNEVETT